jgi:hypothetical protein
VSTNHNPPLLQQSLESLDQQLITLGEALGLPDDNHRQQWHRLVRRKLLPRMAPDFPLTVTICGGGSSGKSSLFNSLVGEAVSPVGGRAGLNRRVLAALNPQQAAKEGFLQALFEPFGTPPQAFVQAEDLLAPGAPLYATHDAIPTNLILLDTPDFDTGARGVYANRDIAAHALEVSDVLVYIFTNSNYSNRDNTDFIARMLTGIGQRRCILVYRVYPSFSANEVKEHALTVAHNLYGSEAEHYLLGIFRADDDNAVAAGERPMSIHPIGQNQPELPDLLGQIDVKTIRLNLMASILSDALAKARQFRQAAQQSADWLDAYLQVLRTAQSRCVHQAVSHLPIERVMKRFAEIWMATDPSYIRFMRKTGRLLDWPVRALWRTLTHKRSEEGAAQRQAAPSQDAALEQIETDLLKAASDLYALAISNAVKVTLPDNDALVSKLKGYANQTAIRFESAPRGYTTIVVKAHPALAVYRHDLQQQNWQTLLSALQAKRDLLLSISAEIDAELERLAGRMRSEMKFWDRTRQTFAAALNILPATAAVTYILATGDPVGATGIKIKLTGLFGLHDLYALVALPATSGLNKADREQLKMVLQPLAQTWLRHKLEDIQRLFEDAITHALLNGGLAVAEKTVSLCKQIDADLQTCDRELGAHETHQTDN